MVGVAVRCGEKLCSSIATTEKSACRTRLELAFLVARVLATEAAVLALLELVGGLLALVRRVVPIPALRAHEKDVAFLDLHIEKRSALGWGFGPAALARGKVDRRNAPHLLSGRLGGSRSLSRAGAGRTAGVGLLGVDYSMTLVTTPAPTVRPPSRIAKRSCSSIAMGVFRVTSILTLSPGMHISAPPRRFAEPVTSVVRK